MTDAERTRIAEAAREAAKDAPPLSADVLAMLRHDRCPIAAKAKRGAA